MKLNDLGPKIYIEVFRGALVGAGDLSLHCICGGAFISHFRALGSYLCHIRSDAFVYYSKSVRNHEKDSISQICTQYNDTSCMGLYSIIGTFLFFSSSRPNSGAHQSKYFNTSHHQPFSSNSNSTPNLPHDLLPNSPTQLPPKLPPTLPTLPLLLLLLLLLIPNHHTSPPPPSRNLQPLLLRPAKRITNRTPSCLVRWIVTGVVYDCVGGWVIERIVFVEACWEAGWGWFVGGVE